MRLIAFDCRKMLVFVKNQFRLQPSEIELTQNPPVHSLGVDQKEIESSHQVATEQGRDGVRWYFFPNDRAARLTVSLAPELP